MFTNRTASAPAEGWLAVASSADGTKLVAVAGVDPGGPIYTSTNYGATWERANAPIARWFCVASSADGSKLAAGAFGDRPGSGIYTSANGGKDWQLTSAPTSEGWLSIACSADGTKLVATSQGLNYQGGPIYVSGDSGVTWLKTDAPIQIWNSVACSADGTKIMASVWYGSIYTMQFPAWSSSADQSAPVLSINLSGQGLSWLVPPSSFVLQQSSDLTTTDWTEVQTTPSFNFTNLHYEVNVSPSAGSRFYRLKQQ